jgi:integrase
VAKYRNRWVARFTDDHGQRRAYYTDSERTAREWLIDQQYLRGRGTLPSVRESSVESYLWEWLERRAPNLRPSTCRSYTLHVDRYLVPHLGRIALSDLRAGHVEAMLDRLRKGEPAPGQVVDATHPIRPLSPQTVGLVRATLRAALGNAKKKHLINDNEAELADAPSVSRHRATVLSFDQAQALFDAAQSHRWGIAFIVALTTGLRRGELLALRWEDLDLDAGTLTVRHSLQMVDGKPTLVEPKSEYAVAKVPIQFNLTIEMLRGHRAAQDDLKLLVGDDWQDLGFVFASVTGTPISASHLSRSFRKFLAVHGLPGMRFHDLRHSCATFMIANGESPRVVMAQLRHSQISTTMNIYADVLDDTLKASAARMDAMFGGKA